MLYEISYGLIPFFFSMGAGYFAGNVSKGKMALASINTMLVDYALPFALFVYTAKMQTGSFSSHIPLVGNERTAGYVQRLRSIESEANEARQSLLLDNLILDLSSDIETVRSQGAALAQLAELSLELQGGDSSAAATLQEAIAACDAATPADWLAALVEECRALVSDEAQRKTAQSRRDVILHGLAKLGYEVHEGMTTA
ncbi:hypothetical protein PQR33_22565 [Paraburkholderia sediminicola]|uniref:hypothetical protein n=1 Tax=Paraburkholderia sediminicola TaxID=458836 RepID=UPI0038BBB68E